MDRRIVGFARDDADDWVARLDCGHARHVRHAPPFQERAWVTRAETREARVGTALGCTRCDRREMPETYRETRRTPSFDEASIPAGLQRRHTTRPGVWARIVVERGALHYHVHEPFDTRERLVPGVEGIVLPEVEHEVSPDGAVRFHVAFYGPPGD